MTSSVLHRTWRGLKRWFETVRSPHRASPSQDDGWVLERSRRTETRWECGGETVRCFRFDDGYVSVAEYDRRNVTWQLTPGQVPLASALAMTALYLQHDVTPQIDPEGRPFVAVGPDGPRQVFEEIADEPVDYVYLDTLRTLEEFPPFLDADETLEHVYDRMSPARYRTLE